MDATGINGIKFELCHQPPLVDKLVGVWQKISSGKAISVNAYYQIGRALQPLSSSMCQAYLSALQSTDTAFESDVFEEGLDP